MSKAVLTGDIQSASLFSDKMVVFEGHGLQVE